MLAHLANYWLELEIACVLLALALACARPGLARRAERATSRALRPVYTRGALAVAVAGALPLCLRLVILPFTGIPWPRVPDEFGYLLASDTFAAGRLTNPTHPFWMHLEAPFVIHEPSYASMYPPAQGLLLAAGQTLAGHPWWGVWISLGLLGAAVCWMLRGWVPAGWAFLGAALVGLRLGVFSYWASSYWGGAVAAIGGALVLGALPRLKKTARPRDALCLGLGLVVLANSRPYEGLVLALPIGVALLGWLLFHATTPIGTKLLRVVLPVAGVLGLAGLGMAGYFEAITGEATRMPYAVHSATYGVQPNLWLQPPRPGVEYRHVELEHVFEIWNHRYHLARTSEGAIGGTLMKARQLWTFYVGPELTLALFLVPWLLRDRSKRILWVAFAVFLLGLVAEVSFFPHYAAPATALFALIVVQGLRHLRSLGSRPRPVGRALCLAVPLALVLLFATRLATQTRDLPVRFWSHPHDPWSQRPPTDTDRHFAEERLLAEGGRHLVLLRYTAEIHHRKWTYNAADVDAAAIVWASELDPAADRRLIEAMPDRRVWLAHPDATPPRLEPHPEVSQVVSSTGRGTEDS